MSEMIERVAKAIQRRALERGTNPVHPAAIHHLAAAAIEAMREPTVEMLVAAQEDWMCVRAAEERGDFIWRAMIDAALNEGAEK
ncbi:hypothetical protein V1290_000035 [Bradyrhizobium sp. AZCC 1578]|uniref:hypothetical protein n=1 Tax=Bradyrhizobium sp. AZCC 1578 TaxID=3117027 RepID=UPI002FF29422